MKLIQPVLVLLLLLFGVLYMSRFRTRLRDRLIVAVLVAVGIFMVAVPDVANRAAHFFGVGRGADLIMYLGLSGLSFLWLLLYGKMRGLERKVTLLTRLLAIEKAHPPEPEGVGRAAVDREEIEA